VKIIYLKSQNIMENRDNLLSLFSLSLSLSVFYFLSIKINGIQSIKKFILFYWSD